jgi:hypothetical protein
MLKPIRNEGYGLASTYFAAPSAPLWTRNRADVIALPITHGISTLSFGMDVEKQLKPVVRDAYLFTLARMKGDPNLFGRR